MTVSTEPAVRLSHLPKSDGSATFSHEGFTVVAAVNGPIEAGRRDENPFEAVIDVVVRPGAGVGGTAERQLESILQAALHTLIPVRDLPRSMIQVTLQLTQEPENAYVNTKTVQAQMNLTVIPVLLHAAMLALLAGAVPLKGIATGICLAIMDDKATDIKVDPTSRQADQATSVHVLAFTARDELLISESEGSFTPKDWDKVLELGESICCGPSEEADVDMGDPQESRNVRSFIREVMKSKAAQDLRRR